MQGDLFDTPPLAQAPEWPPGFVCEPDFLCAEEQSGLIALVETLGLEAARYKGYTARRRIASFGGSFDYDTNRLLPSRDLVPELFPLRERVAAWLGVRPEALAHVLVAEYAPGTQLGWHRDVPQFEKVAGVSLGGEATMRLRPYPPVRARRSEIVRVPLVPGSIYRIEGAARWRWQHSIAPTKALRWSITFRTLSSHAQARSTHFSYRPSARRPGSYFALSCS